MGSSANSRSAVSLALALAAFVVAACDAGEPPVISNFMPNGNALRVNEPGTIDGTFDFVDPDGDVVWLNVELTVPGGARGRLPRAELQGLDGTTSDTITWVLFLQPMVTGSFDYELWLTDDGGNDSNRLGGRFESLP